LLLVLVGFAAIGVPSTTQVSGWLIGVAAISAALIVAYISVLRFDLSMLPIAVGTMTAAGGLGRAMERAYPGAVAGALAGIVVALITGWWLFGAVRAARAHMNPSNPL
jgi:hypothetical protein